VTDYSENMRGLLLQETYERHVRGSRRPHVMVVTGAFLNRELLTDQYDPQVSYQVSRHVGEARPVITAVQGEQMESPDPMLQFFEYAHLPVRLQAVSKPFCDLAHAICAVPDPVHGLPHAVVCGPLPRNPERTVALRKLLEAKDCAVRAVLYKP
jgi:hypothetical protein